MFKEIDDDFREVYSINSTSLKVNSGKTPRTRAVFINYLLYINDKHAIYHLVTYEIKIKVNLAFC